MSAVRKPILYFIGIQQPIFNFFGAHQPIFNFICIQRRVVGRLIGGKNRLFPMFEELSQTVRHTFGDGVDNETCFCCEWDRWWNLNINVTKMSDC